jgi:hypothetical protein
MAGRQGGRSERVDTIDQAVAVIRDAVVSSMPTSKPN